MKTKPRLNRKVQLAFGSAILALLMVGAISYRGMVVFSESGQWVRHTDEVLASLEDLVLSMKAIEASARGFALTGNESYLADFRASELKARQDEAIISNLTVDNPVQQRRMLGLEALVAQKIQLAEVGVDSTRKVSQPEQDILTGGQGQQIMDELQDTLRNMRVEELRLLMLREADLKRRLARPKPF